MKHSAALSAAVALQPESLAATVNDQRADVLALFQPLSDDQRQTLVLDAWSVGLRALMNAYRQAEESKLADVGKALVAEVDQRLRTQAEHQQVLMVNLLQTYFDPTDGAVSQRIQAFVQDGGELARALEPYLSPDHGVLAKTLARELGESSPLLKRLSPTDSEGLVCVLEGRIRQLLEQNHQALATALDPVAENGAFARLLRVLRQEMEQADSDRSKQLALATKALDASDETSLLSRLVRATQEAQASVLQAMNPEEPGSPLALLKGSLTTLLEQQAKAQSETMAESEERRRKLDQEIREAVARLEERKRGDAKAPRGGDAFEQSMLRFVRAAVQGAPIVVDDTGRRVGAAMGCKKGDQVLRFGPESIYAGFSVVIEAKHDASFTESQALAELEEARRNRCAQAGVFVMAKSHATPGFPRFARHGNDVLVVWDPEDESCEPALHAAVTLALALASRQHPERSEANIEALADIEQRIQHELTRQEKMKKMAEKIRETAEDLGEELRKGGDKMKLLLRNAKETLQALNVELKDAAAERGEPIQLPEDSLEAACHAVGANEAA